MNKFFLIFGFGLTMTICWFAGWPMLALWLFAISALLQIVNLCVDIKNITRGLNLRDGPDVIVASAAVHLTKNRTRELLTVMTSSLGAIGCWPFRAAIGGIGGSILGFMLRIVGMRTEGEVLRGFTFLVPLPILVLPAFALQSAFMMAGFSDEVSAHWLFKGLVVFQLLTFVIFLAHFHLRKRFEKNFSASAMPPALFFVLAMIGVLAAAVLIRQLYEATFTAGVEQVSFENSFDTFRLIMNNSGLFDLIGTIRTTDSLDALMAQMMGFLGALDFARVVDIFLGFSFLSTFGRSLWTMLTFSREDEDRAARAVSFIQLRDFDRANREVKTIESAEIRAQPAALLALIDRDLQSFTYEIGHLPKGDMIRSFGDDPIVTHYLALQAVVMSAPLELSEMFDIIGDFNTAHDRRAVQAGVMMSYFLMAKADINEIIQIAQTHPVAETLLSFLVTVSEINDGEDDDLDALEDVATAFPVDTNIANLVVALSAIGMYSGETDKTPAQTKRVRGRIDALLASTKTHLETPENVSTIFLAMAVQVWQGDTAHKIVFGEANPHITEIMPMVESALRARNLRVPDFIESLSKAKLHI